MSDTNEALWQAFYAEVSEQLQELELLLVRSDVNESEQVDSVFRLFHTIKSSAAMMAYTSMEHLAHDCEDLLDLARKRTIELDAAIVDVLLKAVDHLKFQLDQTQKTRENPPENAPLIEEIQSLLKKAGKGGGPPATASGETSAPAANSSNSDGEVSEILGTYAAVCRDNLPRLFAVHASAKARKATRNAIEKLRQGSDDVGFHGVSALLRKLEAMPSGANPDDDRLRLRLKADIIDKLRYAERIAGMDWGLAELSAELAGDHKIQLRRHLETAVASLNAIFGDLTATRTEGMASRLSAVLIPVEDAVNLTRIIGFETTASLLTLIRQVLRDLTRGSLDCTAELVEMVRIAVALPLEISGDESESEHYRILCEETLEELRRVLAGGEGAETTGTKLQRIRAVLEIGQDYLDLLTPRAVSDLLEIVNRREQVIEIEADLEKDPETGESFVQWLTDNGRIISNRTVIHREKRGGKETERAALRFLVQSDTPAAELKEALGSLDPDRRLFELHLCRYKDEIPDAGTASDTESARSPSRPPQHGQAADTVRIDSETLDGFVSRVGEMVTLRNMVAHAANSESLQAGLSRARALIDRAAGDTSTEGRQALAELGAILGEFADQQERLMESDTGLQNTLKRLQQDVLDLRVVPIALVFNRMPRVARSISKAQGKEVELDFHGSESRIDKSMIELLSDPLIHIVRNSVDHGIEMPTEREALGKPATATLRLSARQQGNTIQIEIGDDGRGLNYEKIRARAVERGLVESDAAALLSESQLKEMIFTPGFSTADSVTETSGRGVGLDVVKTQIGALGGNIEVESAESKGTTFRLRLPVSVAIQPVVVVAAGPYSVALPERSILEILEIDQKELQSVRGQSAILLRGTMLPVYRLNRLMRSGSDHAGSNGTQEAVGYNVIVLTNGTNRIGLIVDSVEGRHEAFVRDPHPAIAEIPGIGGTSILGNGRVAMIAETEGLLALARRTSESAHELSRVM